MFEVERMQRLVRYDLERSPGRWEQNVVKEVAPALLPAFGAFDWRPLVTNLGLLTRSFRSSKTLHLEVTAV